MQFFFLFKHSVMTSPAFNILLHFKFFFFMRFVMAWEVVNCTKKLHDKGDSIILLKIKQKIFDLIFSTEMSKLGSNASYWCKENQNLDPWIQWSAKYCIILPCSLQRNVQFGNLVKWSEGFRNMQQISVHIQCFFLNIEYATVDHEIIHLSSFVKIDA